jgi:hypothetical protein
MLHLLSTDNIQQFTVYTTSSYYIIYKGQALHDRNTAHIFNLSFFQDLVLKTSTVPSLMVLCLHDHISSKVAKIINWRVIKFVSKWNILQWTGYLPLKSMTLLSQYSDRLYVGWLRNQCLIPNTRQEIFLHAGSAAHLPSYPMGTVGPFLGGSLNGWDVKLTTHLHQYQGQEYLELFLHSLTCLHGTVVN